MIEGKRGAHLSCIYLKTARSSCAGDQRLITLSQGGGGAPLQPQVRQNSSGPRLCTAFASRRLAQLSKKVTHESKPCPHNSLSAWTIDNNTPTNSGRFSPLLGPIGRVEYFPSLKKPPIHPLHPPGGKKERKKENVLCTTHPLRDRDFRRTNDESRQSTHGETSL